MTVAELVDKLLTHPLNTEVYIGYEGIVSEARTVRKPAERERVYDRSLAVVISEES